MKKLTTLFFALILSLNSLGFSQKKSKVDDGIVLLARVTLPLLLTQTQLDPAVKKRFNKFLYQKDFRVLIVPFLLSLKDVYLKSPKVNIESFDEYVRSQDEEFTNTPGINHELFQLNPPPSQSNGLASQIFSKSTLRIIETFVELFDALYLQENISLSQLNKSTKEILLKLLGVIEYDGIDEGIQNIIDDPEKLEAVSITLKNFLERIFTRHYEIWRARVELGDVALDWLNNRFAKNEYDELTRYLEWGMNKKLAVHFVVDGLQGSLMKSLSRKNLTFLEQVKLESQNRGLLKPSIASTEAPRQNENFLFARRPWSDKYLPFFKDVYRKGKIIESGIATSPTISVKNLPIAMTGYDVEGPMGGTGLPNFHYVDRKGEDREDQKSRAYYFYGNDAIELNRIARKHGMKTLFSKLEKKGLFSLACNVSYDERALFSIDAFITLALGETQRDFGEILCEKDIFDRALIEKDLNYYRKEIIAKINILKNNKELSNFKIYFLKKQIKSLFTKYSKNLTSGLPSFVQIYNPWPDHFAHFYGPFSDSIISHSGELNRLDYWIGRIDKIYKNFGFYERTLFAMAGDHGLSPVYYLLNPENFIFDDLKDRIKIKKISSDEGEGPKITHPEKFDSMKGYDAVIASTAGGNYMIDLFFSDGVNWKEQPLYKDILNFKTINGDVINFEKKIVESLKDSLDFMATRAEPSSFDASKIVFTSFREGKIKRSTITRRKSKVFYQGADLFEISQTTHYRSLSATDYRVYEELLQKCYKDAIYEDLDSWCSEDQWFDLTLYTNRPGSISQLSRIYDSEKAGTINLFPAFGVGYNSKVPGRHAGEHFHEKDAFIGIWGGGAKDFTHAPKAINGQLPPTIFKYLTGTKGEFSFESL